MDDLVKVQDDSNYCTSLLILPTELLVMILSHLSIRDIISIQFVSQRLRRSVKHRHCGRNLFGLTMNLVMCVM